jgi:putative MATE family efflux protein
VPPGPSARPDTAPRSALHARDRRILALALPAVVTLAADPLMGLVDTAVVGRLGAAELGALGLAVAVLTALSWIFNFLVFGTTSTVARAVGAGHLDVAGRRVVHAASVAVGLGLVVGGVLLVAGPTLLRSVGAVEELLPPASTYLRIRALGVPFLLLSFVGHGAFRGVSDTRTPLLVVVVANVVNAVLTFWLVFGVGLGIAGAAWATVAAEVITVLIFATLLGRTRLPLAGHGLPRRAELTALVVVSRDLFLRTGGLVLGLLAITAAAARIDAVTAAAYQVLYQLFLLVSFLLDGIAIAGQAMVGTALGAGDEDEARATGRALLRWGVAGGAAIAVLFLVGSRVLPRVLTDDPAVLALLATTWWFAALGHAVNGPTFALDGVLMGAEDFGYLRTWTVAAAVLGGVTAQLVASLGGGLFGLWAAVQLMMVVRLASLVLRVRGDGWARTGSGLVTDDPHG